MVSRAIWKKHARMSFSKTTFCCFQLAILYLLNYLYFLPATVLEQFYFKVVLPSITYAGSRYCGVGKLVKNHLDDVPANETMT